MGQTLTHGVYLPDEGERNCYNGLAANWQLLDGAVGTIAEHSTQIAGKAPAVHTHTKSDITDFPAYGTTAGTICEGNDSRLSDARTPVAHTHGKADITDLLNSNFIPSANNSYDLGSSSYQWNNLYAKGYYYNGVAWGLDKANIWSGENTFSNTLSIAGNTIFARDRPQVTIGTIPSNSTFYGVTRFRDNNNNSFAFERGTISSTWNYRKWFVYNFSDVSMYSAFELGIKHDGSEKYFLIDSDKLIPNTTGVSDLGTSTNKWKSLNGINPGALSLPDIYDSYNVITSNWNTAYAQPNTLLINGANPSYPGWLFIRLDDCTAADDFLIVRYYHVNAANLTFFGSFIPTASSYVLSVPIQAGITIKVWVSKIPTYCKYYACLGAVK